MKLGRYMLAACLLLVPSLAQAQDFGVLESAETINRGNFKLKVAPILLVRDGDRRPGIVAGFGYGFTDRFDVEAKFAKYEGVTLVGGDAEYWLVKGQKTVDLSVSAGFHYVKADSGDQTAVDVTVIGSHAVTPKFDIYAALDMAFNKFRDAFPNNHFTQVHVVPGIEYKIHPDLDLVAEFGIAANDNGRHYISGGIAYYFR